MAATRVRCVTCGKTYALAEESLGQRFRCTACDTVFVAAAEEGLVPVTDAPAPPPTPPPTPLPPQAAPPHAPPAGKEQTLWEGRPSGRLLIGRMVAAGATVVVLAGLAYAAYTYGLPRVASLAPDLRPLVEQHRTHVLLALAGGVGLVALVSAVRLLFAWLKLRRTLYKVTNQRLVVEGGVIAKSFEEIDLRTVDDSSFSQTTLERLSGIGRVTVVSTDKSCPHLVMIGIVNPKTVRETIRTAAYDVSQRVGFLRGT